MALLSRCPELCHSLDALKYAIFNTNILFQHNLINHTDVENAADGMHLQLQGKLAVLPCGADQPADDEVMSVVWTSMATVSKVDAANSMANRRQLKQTVNNFSNQFNGSKRIDLSNKHHLDWFKESVRIQQHSAFVICDLPLTSHLVQCCCDCSAEDHETASCGSLVAGEKAACGEGDSAQPTGLCEQEEQKGAGEEGVGRGESQQPSAGRGEQGGGCQHPSAGRGGAAAGHQSGNGTRLWPGTHSGEDEHIGLFDRHSAYLVTS